MASTDQRPRLRLTFSGDGFPLGAVPLTVVASRLGALQQAMFHAAAAASGHTGRRTGLWFNRFRSAAELTFAASHHSDLVIEAELAADPVLHEDFDVGSQAVDLLFDVAASCVHEGHVGKPMGRLDREYISRAVEGLMPNAGDQYEIRLENCRHAEHAPVIFTSVTRSQLRARCTSQVQSFEADEATIVGELVKIHIDAGDDKITLRWQQRNVDCFYGDAMRDQIANLIAGSMVEVSGSATLNERGDVHQIRNLMSVEQVSMEPVRIARFEHGGRVFPLVSPIPVNIEYADGLWVYSHPALNLWGYAERREQALKNLHADFHDLYSQIAEESPGQLDAVAQRLQERLRALVGPAAGALPNA